MKTAKISWILGVAALAGCASDKGASSDEYLSAAPELSALELGVTDDSSSEGTATDDDAIDELALGLEESGASLPVNVAPELAESRSAVRDLNQSLRAFLQPIVALVRNSEPERSGSVRTWGPVTRGATEYRFVMRRGVLRRFGWLLQARAAGSSDDFAAVAAGGITVGYAARRGVGTVGIDLDALGTFDPTVVARGTLLASFAHGPNGSALAYRFRDFSPNPAQKAGVNAVVQGVHSKAGANRLRLAYYGNVAGSATHANELVLARVRHARGAGGRADLLATGGDVADGQVLVVSECWSAGLQSVYRVVRECPADGIGGAQCTELSSEGEHSACPGDLREAELPPTDALDSMSDPESPEGDVTPPSGMPDGEPPTAD